MFASATAFFTSNSAFPKAKLIPLIIQLGDYLKIGFEHYTQLKLMGQHLSVDGLAIFIFTQMKEWDPKVNGSSILDADTKRSASRFLAGVAINLFNDGE